MPQSNTKSVDRTFKTLVIQADPDFEIEKRREPEYEFPGRTFTANPATRHPYNRED